MSLLSLGFVLASLVPTARFALPLGSILIYSLLPISGLFFPLEVLPAPCRGVAFASPLTHGVDLLRGLWTGEEWTSHRPAVLALLANLAIHAAISSRIFRWE